MSGRIDLVQQPPLLRSGKSLQLRRPHHRGAQGVRVQAQQRLELIVVDDASTDEGTAVVERWIDDCLC